MATNTFVKKTDEELLSSLENAQIGGSALQAAYAEFDRRLSERNTEAAERAERAASGAALWAKISIGVIAGAAILQAGATILAACISR